jgi:effector-binding domain-containing protein
MKFVRSSVFVSFFALLLWSCGGDKNDVVERPAKVMQKISDSTAFSNNITVYNNKPGVLGIFDVPEMLVLSIMDSAALEHVADKMGRDYDILEKEITTIGAEINGPGGSIIYNNKLNNFKFETVVCIHKIPTKQPKKASIVILEACPMLIFNFYGSYQNLFSAYDKIKKYCKQNKLLQNGPLREFYMTDPAVEKNPDKWLTRIMVPVMPIKDEE